MANPTEPNIWPACRVARPSSLVASSASLVSRALRPASASVSPLAEAKDWTKMSSDVWAAWAVVDVLVKPAK